MNFCGMNGDTTKHINRQQVLKLLSREPGISRTEIAARMGLVKMTVSNIIAEMLHSGMVAETKATGVEKTGAGRKLTGLCFSENAPVLAGIHLEGTKLNIGIFSMELKKLGQSECSVGDSDSIDQIVSGVMTLVKNSGRSLLGAALALGPGWSSTLGEPLKTKLNVPVFTASSAAADAYAVARSAEYKRFLCLSIAPAGPVPAPDAGVRAAAMADGVLLGDPNGCIPLGQMTEKNRPLAEVVSIAAICRHISSTLGAECRNLSEAQKACWNSSDAAAALSELFKPLTDAVCNICMVVHPEALALDHRLAGFGKKLADDLFSKLYARLGNDAPAVISPAYGSDTTLFGVACMVLEKVFNDTLGYDIFFKE